MSATSLDKIVATIGPQRTLRLLDHDDDGEVDPNILTQVMSATDTDLRTVIGRAYTAEEFAKAGEDLTNIATTVAIQHAYLTRPELKDDDGNTPWQGQYDAAVARAKEVASGRARIDRDGSGRAAPQNAMGYVRPVVRYFTGPGGTGDF